MAVDIKKANEFRKKIEAISTFCNGDNRDLFADDDLADLERLIRDFDFAMEQAQKDGRLLRIGVIGAVKAGKSSFLNALLFQGREVLPKASTPMTAALTKLSYSPTPKAIIHYYSQEDWEKICENAREYDRKLDEQYKRYLDDYQEKLRANSYSGDTYSVQIHYSKDEYIKVSQFNNKVSEVVRSCKELVLMADKISGDLLSKLGTKDTIDGEVIQKLNNYVGAEGTYTPIVNYVELQIADENLKDLEIVDTPGLNDPIVSRTRATKEFLVQCDVAVLLSPCSQFMDSSTVELMLNKFPNAGINEVVVVGSKLDSGLLDHQKEKDELQNAYRHSISTYLKQYKNTIENLQKRVENKHVSVLTDSEPIFVSSMFYSMAQKSQKKMAFSEEEELIDGQLKKRFSGYDRNTKFWLMYSGIGKVRKRLNEVLEKKTEIINQKNEEFLNRYRMNIAKLLRNMEDNMHSTQRKIRENDADSLETRYLSVQEALDRSRKRISLIFDGAALECKKRINLMLPRLQEAIGGYEKISIASHQSESTDTYRTGLFGLRKEVRTTYTTTYSADIAQTTRNLEMYISYCQKIVSEEFSYILNRQEIGNKIKEAVLLTYSASGVDYSEDDILLPLDNILSRLEIPELNDIDENHYIDEFQSQFPAHVASGEEIHRLKNMQAKALVAIKNQIIADLKKNSQAITALLEEQAVYFSDDVSVKLRQNQEKLRELIKNKEGSILRYEKATNEISSFLQLMRE